MAAGIGKTIGTTVIPAESVRMSGITVILAEIRCIGEIWTIMAVSPIQMVKIWVTGCKMVVAVEHTSTTALQVGKGMVIIMVLKMS